MKVLWLTNHLLPEHAEALGKRTAPSGGWLHSLAGALVESGQVRLALATNVPKCQWSHHPLNGISYFTIPISNVSANYKTITAELIHDYQRVVEEFNPDVVHIHGTEYFLGFLTGNKHINVPTVISIQGIIDYCARHYLDGIPLRVLLCKRTLRDWVRLDGLLEQQFVWRRRAAEEREIFATNSAFIGRTLWDRAHTRRMNPKARYYHCDELIRQPFYDAHRDIRRIKRHSIFASSAIYPLKGFHVLVKAAAMLRKEFPDITIRTPLVNLYPTCAGAERIWKNCRANGYARYLNDLIHSEGLDNNIFPLPYLDAAEMVRELLSAHVFVLPSFIENSPNSLAEAMLIGTPSIASFVGGVPSMVKDGVSALCFPAGDEVMLAEQIRRVFLDDHLALNLSVRARNVARVRHSKGEIVKAMLNIYNQELSAVELRNPEFRNQY